jgi:kynurenine formamidase
MALADLCGEIPDAFMTALVIRTLPNGPDKKTRRYTADASPPFLTLPAAHYLISRGVQHLLVDVPSVDRYHDDGHLSVHHALLAADRLGATITELIYVPDTLEDGRYLLSLQCPNFDTDAVPSRPVLLPLEEITKGCI